MMKNEKGSSEYDNFGEQHRFIVEVDGEVEKFIMCDGGKFHPIHWKQWKENGFEKAGVKIVDSVVDNDTTVFF